MNTFIRSRAENIKYTITKTAILQIRAQSYVIKLIIKIITNKLVNQCKRMKDESNSDSS